MDTLKTADQINLPQGGGIKITPNPQSVTAVKKNPPAQVVHKVQAPLPEGWFNFQSQGMRAAVVKKIQTSTLPDWWKAALIADIQALDATMNFVSVHAHRHLAKGKYVGHFTIGGKAILE